MSDLTTIGLRTLRRVAGDDSRIETALRQQLRSRRSRRIATERGPGWTQRTGEKFVHVRSDFDGPQRGIFLKGGCDLPAMFLVAERVRDRIAGSVTIYSEGIGISDARADVLLQSLRGVDPAATAEICERLELPATYFEPVLFEPTFQVPGVPRSLPKTVVALTIGPNLVRSAYRHRETDLLVDPGGWWLNQSMDQVLGDLSAATWFRQQFRSAGRLTAEAFADAFGQVVTEVRERTGAHVLVFNTLVLDPQNPIHSYRFVAAPATLRRRRFALALAEVAADRGAHVIDVDHVLKGSGVDTQVDFAHYSAHEQGLIADEVTRVLDELGVWGA